jgi:hypothetical protein
MPGVVRPALALLVVVALLAPAGARAFDPATDRPAADRPGLASPRNLPGRARVEPSALVPDAPVTFTACFALDREQPIGRLWQRWTNDATGDWFFLYAAPAADGFDLTYYTAGRGSLPLGAGLPVNQTHLAGRGTIQAARLPVGRAGDAAAFRLESARLELPADATCGPADDARLVPVALALGLVWGRETSAWPPTTVTLAQAVESGGAAPVYFDGWTDALGRRGQLALRLLPAAEPAPQGELARQIDVGAAVALGRAATLVRAVETSAAAAILLALALPAAWLARRRLAALAGDVLRSAPDFARDVRAETAAALRAEERSHLAALGAVSLVGVGLRLAYLNQPIRGDEAYTYLNYASRPLWTAVSTYNAPNNHVLHSVLVLVAYRLLGDDPWALRLPAFLAGALLVPATYLVGRRLYGREAGLLAAALVAASSILVEYSTNARGYSLTALALLAMLWLAAGQLGRPSPAGWFALGVVAALGLFTLPTMLYGVGVVGGWLLLALARGGACGGRRPALGGLALAAGSMAGLTLLLYAPIVLLNGARALLGNEFVRAQSWSALDQSARAMAVGAWALATRDLPTALTVLLALGFAAAALALEPFRRARAPLAPAVLLVVVLVLGVQRVAPPPRAWLFFLPLCFLIAASLWAPLLARLVARLGMPGSPAVSALSVALAASLGLAVVRGDSILESTETGVLRDAREIAHLLGTSLGPRDRILEMTPSGPELLYYLRKQGLSSANLYTDVARAPRVVVVVNKQWGQSLQDVIGYWSLRGTFVEGARVVREYPSALIYEAVNPSS